MGHYRNNIKPANRWLFCLQFLPHLKQAWHFPVITQTVLTQTVLWNQRLSDISTEVMPYRAKNDVN